MKLSTARRRLQNEKRNAAEAYRQTYDNVCLSLDELFLSLLVAGEL